MILVLFELFTRSHVLHKWNLIYIFFDLSQILVYSRRTTLLWERIFAFVINDFLTQTKDHPSYTRRKGFSHFLSVSVSHDAKFEFQFVSSFFAAGLISPSACRWRQCREWGRWPQIFRPRCWWSKVGCSLLGGRQRWSYLQLLWSRLLLKRKFNIKDVLQFYWMKYNFWWSNIRIQREEDIKWYPQLPFSATYLQHPVFADSEQNRRWLRDRWCPWRSLRTDRAWWGHQGPDWTPQILELCW